MNTQYVLWLALSRQNYHVSDSEISLLRIILSINS